MLADSQRLDAYAKAIAETVRPGDVVVDLGTGTGILALMAARAGARRVYAIEQGPIANIAQSIIAKSPYRDCIQVVRSSIQEALLPERADVVVSEHIGDFPFAEGMDVLLQGVRKHLLHPHAREIPTAISFRLVPVQLPVHLHDTLAISQVQGFDFSAFTEAVESIPMFFPYRDLPPSASLASSIPLCRRGMDPGSWVSPEPIEFEFESDGRLDALALLVSAQLSPSVVLTLDLGCMTHWRCTLLPVQSAPLVCKGMRARCAIAFHQTGVESWSVTLFRKDEAPVTLHHAPLFASYRLGLRQDATAIPLPSARQQIAHAVLANVDGQQSITDIAAKLPQQTLSAMNEADATQAVIRVLERLDLL